jgi:heterodisulfide reductase subunit A-like polyferredoxin
MKRVGVFICHCGTNIAAVVDVKKVAEVAGEMPDVVMLPITSICVPTRGRT